MHCHVYEDNLACIAMTNKIDRPLNEAAAEEIRKYRADYNNNPPNAISFMPAVASTSGRLHSEFVTLLFLQAHRETDRFFAAPGVQLAQSHRGQFHFRRAAFSSQLKSGVNINTPHVPLRQSAEEKKRRKELRVV